MASEVGGIIGSIGLDVAQLRQDVGKSQRELGKFSNKANRSLGKVERGVRNISRSFKGLAGILSAGLIVRQVNRTIESISELGKAADTVGVTTESLQELRFAFGQLAGVTEKQVDTALQRFTRRLGLAANEGGAALKAFEAFGIATRTAEGNVRDANATLNQVLSTLASMESDAERAARASEFFGEEAGPRLAVALQKGSDEIDRLRKKARDLGIVLSDNVVRNAEAASDTLDVLRRTIGIGFTKVIADNASNLQTMAEGLMMVGRVAARVVGNIRALSEGVARLLGAQNLDDQVLELQERLEGLQAQARGATRGRPGGEVPQIIQQQIDQTRDELEKAREQQRIRARLFASLKQPERPTGGQPSDISISQPSGEKEKERQELSAFDRSQIPGGRLMPGEAFQMDVARRLAESAIPAKRRMQELTQETQETGRAAQELGFTFSSAFEDAILKGQSLKGVLGGILQDISRILLRTTVTQPLAQGLSSAFSGFLPFGGARAEGGDVSPGKSFLVGEKGPELFTPGQKGTITPSGKSVQVNVDIDARGADPTVIANLRDLVQQQVIPQAIAGSVEAVREEFSRPEFA